MVFCFQYVNSPQGSSLTLVVDKIAVFSVACVEAQSVSVSSLQLWRRDLFKKMPPWLVMDHLRVCCGHFSFVFLLQVRIHSPSTFSASSSNTDFSACSERRKRRENKLAVIGCDRSFHFCVPSSLSHGEFTRNQKHALMSSDVSVLLSILSHV